MRTGLRKMVSLVLTASLFLTPLLSALATEAADEIQEETLIQEVNNPEKVVVQEETPQETIDVRDDVIVEEPVQEETIQEEQKEVTTAIDDAEAEDSEVEEPSGDEGELKNGSEQEIKSENNDTEGNLKATEDMDADAPEIELKDDQSQDLPAIEETQEAEDDIAIDTTKAASESPAFINGYAEVLRATTVYANENEQDAIAILESGITEVIDRVNAGQEDDYLIIKLLIEEETIIGYVSAKDMKPCTEDEINNWNNSGKELKVQTVLNTPVSEEQTEQKLSEESFDSAENEDVVELEQVELQELEANPETVEIIEVEGNLPELIEEEAAVEEDEIKMAANSLLESIPDSKSLTLNDAVAYDRLLTYHVAMNWEVTLPNAGRIAVYVDPAVDSAYSGNVTVNIWNEAVDTIYVTQSGATAFVMDDIWLDAGNYNIVVDGTGLTNDIVYSIRVTYNEATNAITGYKSFDTPYSLSSSTTYTHGVFTIQDMRDVFLFTVSEASLVNITTRVYEPDVVVSVWDASDMTLGDIWTLPAGSEAAPVLQESDIWLEAGRYYILVTCGSSHGIYDIFAYATSAGTVDTEPNDGRGIAIPISVGETRQGLISMLDEYDYYEINVGTTTEVGISVRETTNGLDIKLYDSNMGLLHNMSSAYPSGGSMTKPLEQYLQYRLEANRPYYLEIHRNHDNTYDWGEGLYTIALTKKLTVESVSVSPTEGGFGTGGIGTTFRITPTVSGGTPVVAEYILYKDTGNPEPNRWQEYWRERTLNPYWDITAMGVTAAQRTLWTGIWKVAYMVYDGHSWTSIGQTKEFVIGGKPTITSITLGLHATNVANVGYDFTVSVTTSGTTPTTYVYDLIHPVKGLLPEKRQILTTSSTLMHVDTVATGYKVMVSVFDGYGGSDVDYSIAFDGYSSATLVTLSLTASGSYLTATLDSAYGIPVSTHYDVYCNGSLVYSTSPDPAPGNAWTYTAQSGGSYYMIATVNNGSMTLPVTVTSNTVTVADSFEVYSVQPNVTSASVGDTVTFTATMTGTATRCTYYLNRVVSGVSTNVAVWTGNTTTHSFTLSNVGSYAVYAIITDGKTEKHLTSNFVTVAQAGSKVVSVTTDKSVVATGELIKATLVTAGAPTIIVRWVVQTTGGTIIRDWTGNSHSFNFTVPTPGSYIVTCVVFGYYGDSGDFDSSSVFTVY